MHTSQQLRATWRMVRAAVARVRVPLFVLLFVLMAGTLVFWLADGRRPIEAFFYTLNLVTLNASGSDAPKAIPLQIMAVAVLVGGVLSLAGGATSILQLVTDQQERQRALASTLSDHIIVCGVGRVGYRVINELIEFGERIVAINKTSDEEWLDEFIARGVVVLLDDARQRQTLLNAGIERASAIIACTSDDLTNLDIALDAREMNPKIKVVLRMFDSNLADKVAKGFNINTAFSVSALAAPALAAAATRARVDYSFRLKGQLLNVTSVTFGAKSSFVGKSIEQVQQYTNCTFVSKETAAGLEMHPNGSYVIQLDDRFNIIGSLETIRTLHR